MIVRLGWTRISLVLHPTHSKTFSETKGDGGEVRLWSKLLYCPRHVYR